MPQNLNMSFNFVEGESLIMGIKGLAVSSGSACTSASLEPSFYVLRALGRSDELAHSSCVMTIGFHDRRIDYAVHHPRKRSAVCVNSAPVGDVQRMASTSAPSSVAADGRRPETT